MENDTFVWGFKGVECPKHAKVLVYPNVLGNTYSISDEGVIYSRLNGCYFTYAYRNGIPYVNLLDENFNLSSKYIKDLVACSFMENYEYYLERGYRLINIDGNASNCNISNLMFIDPKKEY